MLDSNMFCFFFNDTATTEIYTLSLHDALPISIITTVIGEGGSGGALAIAVADQVLMLQDRKSTRLNSSHVRISYAVFCLKKKKCTRKDKCVQQTPGRAQWLELRAPPDRQSHCQ